jgi:hypothetical protein
MGDMTVSEQQTKGTKMERGQEKNGGKWVGQTKRSSEWVWYPTSDQTFDEMCRLFDRLYK